MSKEIILKTKEAEAVAERIRADAAKEASERIRRAEEEGKLLCERAEAEAEAENARKLALTREKADELLCTARRDAQKEVERMLAVADPYVADAVRMIIGEVFEKCQ